jgi:TM2 domain-containing membrane protein YozV
MEGTSDTDWTTLLILSILLGGLGVDHFYTGKIGTGVLKLLTMGGCGIWALYDIIMVVTEKFVDSDGNVVTKQ